MKFKKFERDERLSFWKSFLYEFSLVFVIILINSYGLLMIFDYVIKANFGFAQISVVVALYQIISCTVASVLVYITRARIYSRNIQKICRAAQRVADGDYTVRLEVFKDKVFKNEIDILKEDFNTMVDELTSIERLRDDFVADVSHEIKTPLSVIQGYAELLRNPDLSAEKRAEYIQLISDAIQNLTSLVTNTLKLNKIENQGIVQKEKFFLDEQIRFCVLNFEDKISDKDIELEIDLEEIVIKTDKALLELVWNNLISNAIKFTDFGGKISLRLKKDNQRIYFEIADSGCGMSPQTCGRIFEKFYQGDSSHSQEGNGLGLALVRQVINKLDGDITVSSKEGEGSVFRVLL